MKERPYGRIYTPEILHAGQQKCLVDAWRALWQSGRLIRLLVNKDLSTRYRQSLLGYLWAVLPPFITMVIFALLAEYRVMPLGQLETPYPAFSLWNLSVWYLFSGVLQASTNSLTSAGPLVTKLHFSKDALVVASAGQPVFEFVVRLVPVAGVFIWFGVLPGWQAVFIPPILLSVIAMALGLGFLLSVINLLLRDISNLLSILLFVGLFLAPILYPAPQTGPLAFINAVNPFSSLLVATQELMFQGIMTNPVALSLATVFSLAVLAIGWTVFHVVLPRVIEQA